MTMPAVVLPANIEGARRRFFAKVDVRGPDECWEWKGCRDGNGYGRFRVLGHTFPAGRIALHFDGRSPGEWELACHRCDNPPCCNPAHLFVGTERENQADRATKGRSADLRGTLNGRAKLRPADVRAIRSGTLDHTATGKQFGVSRTTVQHIRTGRRWGHLA